MHHFGDAVCVRGFRAANTSKPNGVRAAYPSGESLNPELVAAVAGRGACSRCTRPNCCFICVVATAAEADLSSNETVPCILYGPYDASVLSDVNNRLSDE